MTQDTITATRRELDLIDRDMRGQIDRRISAEEAQRARLEEHMELRLAELRSRIEQLNGLRREALEDRASFISRDAFEARADKLDEAIERVEKVAAQKLSQITYDSTLVEWQRWRERIERDITKLEGAIATGATVDDALIVAKRERRADLQPWQLWAATATVSVIVIVVNALVLLIH